jgi:hypothetical protein
MSLFYLTNLLHLNCKSVPSKHKNARYHCSGRFCYWVIGWGPITDFSLEEKNEN